MQQYLQMLLILVPAWLVVGAWRLRKRRSTPGAAAAAAMYEMLNEDRRAAVEIVLEERAAWRDPEDKDGNPIAGR